MKLLVFLLIGTLIFGFAFPAVILIAGLVGIVLFALIIAGLLRGNGVRVYTSSKSYDPFRGGSYRKNDPEVIDTTDESLDDHSDFAGSETGDPDEEQEGEIVELPATALRKED
ncbi:MAG TPA: hypothetical protein DCM41_01530 [Synergistaceae bacterium]|nr:hypothetical protein [Synergistaceae bacterium]